MAIVDDVVKEGGLLVQHAFLTACREHPHDKMMSMVHIVFLEMPRPLCVAVRQLSNRVPDGTWRQESEEVMEIDKPRSRHVECGLQIWFKANPI